jgi:hypothetical protein
VVFSVSRCPSSLAFVRSPRSRFVAGGSSHPREARRRRFTPICSVSALLGIQDEGCVRFGYGAVTHCGRPFLNRSPTQHFCNFVVRLMPYVLVPRPRVCNAIRLVHRHGLASTLFARRYSGNRDCFLFLRVMRWFSSPRLPLYPMDSGKVIKV